MSVVVPILSKDYSLGMSSLENSKDEATSQESREKKKMPLLARNLVDYPCSGDENKRYEGHVIWAKMPRDPWWPCRYATEEEIEQVGPVTSGMVAVCFLGYRSLGVVKKDMVLPFAENYARFANKKMRLFLLGLEEADELVLRNENLSGTDFCMVCQANDQQEHVLLCDRCNGEAHMFCLTPPLDRVPEDDWFCPLCERDAPLTVTIRRKDAAKERKRKEEEERKEALARKKLEDALPNKGNGPSSTKSKSSKSDPAESSVTLNKKRTRAPPSSASKSTGGKEDSKPALSGLRLHFRLDKTNQIPADDSSVKSASRTNQSTPSSKRITSSDDDSDTASSRKSKKKKRATSGTSQSSQAAIAAPVVEVKKTDDSCFVCGDGGNLVLCDFGNCPRVYHNSCLGKARIDVGQPSGVRWFCPWHTCAVCNALEDECSAPGTGNRSASPKTLDLKRKRQESTPIATPPPSMFSFKCAVVSDSRQVVDKPIGRGENGIKFSRCCSCPLALCHQHVGTLIAVPGVDVSLSVPIASETDKNGYFACTTCRGCKLDSESKTRIDLPRVVVARSLQLAWSRIVNGHYHLATPFLYRNVLQVEEGALNETDSSSETSPQCLDDIRMKVWNLQYNSMQEFIADVQLVVQFMKSKIEKNLEGSKIQGDFTRELEENHRLVSEAAGSITLILDEIIAKLRARIVRMESRGSMESRMISAWLRSSSDRTKRTQNTRKLKLHFWDEEKECPFDETDAMSIPEWATFLEASPIGSKLVPSSGAPNYYLGPRHEVNGIAALISAAEHETSPATSAGQYAIREPRQAPTLENMNIGKFLDSLPPSREDMEHMIQEQSRLLRTALQSHAKIRQAVDRMYRAQEAIVSTNESSVPISIGSVSEGRTVAEYSLANRSLRAKITALQNEIQELKADKERGV